MQPVNQTSSAVEIRCCRNIDEQAMLLDAWNQSYCQTSTGGQEIGVVGRCRCEASDGIC